MTDQKSVGQPKNGEPSAPRLTLADIESKVVTVHYHRVPETTTTVCSLVLANGFTVSGTSACISASRFDQQIGEDIAYAKALEKVWDLEGYLLKEKESLKARTPSERVTDELADLALKLGQLTTLLNRPERPTFISTIHWALLHGQQKAMKAYSKILLKRLELFERGE